MATGAATCSFASPTKIPPERKFTTSRATRPCAALRPVYENFPGWSEDVSQVRHFAGLPRNAQRYVAAMMKSLLDVAYEGGAWPAPEKLPNLRYLGVGAAPAQIIKDVPASAELVKLV